MFKSLSFGRARPRRAARTSDLPRRSAAAISSSVRTSLASDMSSNGSTNSLVRGRTVLGFVDAHARTGAFDADEDAAEAPASLVRRLELDLHDLRRHDARSRSGAPAADRARARISPAVGAIDRIGGIEHRRQRARRGLAFLDRHRAVGPLGHHLHRAAVVGRTPGPAPRESRARAEPARRSWRRVPRHRCRRSRAARKARCGRRRSGVLLRRSQMSSSVGYPSFRYVPGLAAAPAAGNKKERVPGGAHSHEPIENSTVMRCRTRRAKYSDLRRRRKMENRGRGGFQSHTAAASTARGSRQTRRNTR